MSDFTDITEKLVAEATRRENNLLETYLKFYLEATGLKVTDLVLVRKLNYLEGSEEIRWFVQQKTGVDKYEPEVLQALAREWERNAFAAARRQDYRGDFDFPTVESWWEYRQKDEG